jgi:hypothetical protein
LAGSDNDRSRWVSRSSSPEIERKRARATFRNSSMSFIIRRLILGEGLTAEVRA